MSNDRTGEADVLRADPSGARPSPVPGLSQAEFDELAENLRWFGRLTLRQKLRAIEEHQDELLRLQRLGRTDPIRAG